ncbi:MAG: segregation/condensation protein A [Lachnospiraceae bacterium]|nr:segregation/condensation protein A [Lachnospiraceae bacterium]
MEIKFKLENFDGPLDLLLHLIDVNEIDIFDIPIAKLTEQYLEYVGSIEDADMESMSEFMYMAAVLLNIKSKMLLPKVIDEETGEEIDPRQELVERLLEYKMYKYAGEELKDRQEDADRILFKESTIPEEISDIKEEVDVSEILDGVTLKKLSDIFYNVMNRQIERIDPVRSKFGTIKKEPVSLESRVSYIRDYGKKHKNFKFEKLLEESGDKLTLIVTFLGVLELIKSGFLKVYQDDTFSDIMLECTDGKDNNQNKDETMAQSEDETDTQGE